MKFEDYYSPRQIELWRYALKLKRIGIDNKTFIVDLREFEQETRTPINHENLPMRAQRAKRRAEVKALDDLIISLLNPHRKERV